MSVGLNSGNLVFAVVPKGFENIITFGTDNPLIAEVTASNPVVPSGDQYVKISLNVHGNNVGSCKITALAGSSEALTTLNVAVYKKKKATVAYHIIVDAHSGVRAPASDIYTAGYLKTLLANCFLPQSWVDFDVTVDTVSVDWDYDDNGYVNLIHVPDHGYYDHKEFAAISNGARDADALINIYRVPAIGGVFYAGDRKTDPYTRETFFWGTAGDNESDFTMAHEVGHDLQLPHPPGDVPGSYTDRLMSQWVDTIPEHFELNKKEWDTSNHTKP